MDKPGHATKFAVLSRGINMSKKSVFISHISREAELAEILKNSLEKHFHGLLDIFVSSDRETIQAGSKWLVGVEKALKSADVQITLCSEESIGRPWVNFEAGAVWLRGIPLIPLCHSGIKPDDLPVPFNMLEGFECSHAPGLQKLYDVVAKILGVRTPATDLQKVVSEMNAFEKKYIEQRSECEIIENPRILCAASEQYAQPSLGFDLDVAVLKKSFPNCVEVEKKLTSKRFRELLLDTKRPGFDIVHLVLAVNPANGDLIFSPIEYKTFKPLTSSLDIITAEGFADLLLESKTKLVVLATCNALLLAVEVAHVANMAASDTEISGEAACKWEECFYDLLAQGMSVHKAFKMTKNQSNTPIRTIRSKDVAFKLVHLDNLKKK